MLRTLRTKTRKIMLATLILVIPSFIFFYGWGSIQDRNTQAEMAFGRFKPADGEWIEVQRTDLYFAQWRLQRQFMNELITILGGGEQAMEYAGELVRRVGVNNLFPAEDLMQEAMDEHAMMQWSEEHGLAVSDAEVSEQLTMLLSQYPPEVRRRVLVQMGLPADNPHPYLRRSELLGRVEAAIASDVRVSKFEAWEQFRLLEEELTLDYVPLMVDDLHEDVQVTTTALRDYYDENTEDFRVEDQRIYEYAWISESAVADQVEQPEEEDVREWYQANAQEYEHPRGVQVRQIYLAVDDAAETTATRERLADLREQILAGADFGTLANQNTDDRLNQIGEEEPRGGLLRGWVTQQAMYQYGVPFVTTALALEAGEVSEPVRLTSGAYDGWAILKAEAIREAGVAPFEEVRERAKRDLMAFHRRNLFEERLREIGDKVLGYMSVQPLAEDLGMRSGKTSWVLTSQQNIASELGVFDEPTLRYLNEDLGLGDTSELLESTNQMGQAVGFVLSVAEVKPSHIPAFSEVEEAIETAYRSTRAEELAEERARELMAKADNVEALRQAVDDLGMEVAKAGPFKRIEMPEDLPGGTWQGFINESLRATTGTVGLSTAGATPENAQAYVVWRVRAIDAPDRALFEERLMNLEQGLYFSRRSAMIEEWLYDRRQAMEMELQE